MNTAQPRRIRTGNSTDALSGIVRDSSGDEVYAKSLGQRSAIRAGRESEVEAFIAANPGAAPCPDDCSCRKFSHK